MKKFALDKHKYHKLLNYKIKLKYNTKTKIEIKMLFHVVKDEKRTYYISLMRTCFKKMTQSRKRMNKLINKNAGMLVNKKI